MVKSSLIKKKYALCRHCLGSEGRKIFKQLLQQSILEEGDAVDEYLSALRMLDLRFKPHKNVILGR